jgi:Rieske Fe-S protein
MQHSSDPTSGAEPRRGFLAKASALGLAAAAFAAPVLAGLAAALNPLRQKARAGKFYKLASLDALPEDGSPQKFAVIDERVNAWTRSIEPIGAVYLMRTAGPEQVRALQVTCPHAGCSVQFKETVDEESGDKVREFHCPCHQARFDLEGNRLGATSPSPRNLDALAIDPDKLPEVWVQFQEFKTGTAQQVPKA